MTGGSEAATGTPQPDASFEGGTEASALGDTRFAHASEAEMARILDFYAVRWEYEPTTFPILWNLDGEVVESFAPDFYLPDLEMFLEMTTLKQRLVRKKNRKLRRLKELYPDIRIKLFYARDFRAMMLKYGRLGLAESLSGAPGQVLPDRPPVVAPGAAIEALAGADVGPVGGDGPVVVLAPAGSRATADAPAADVPAADVPAADAPAAEAPAAVVGAGEAHPADDDAAPPTAADPAIDGGAVDTSVTATPARERPLGRSRRRRRRSRPGTSTTTQAAIEREAGA